MHHRPRLYVYGATDDGHCTIDELSRAYGLPEDAS
jgi:hypothetical protein